MISSTDLQAFRTAPHPRMHPTPGFSPLRLRNWRLVLHPDHLHYAVRVEYTEEERRINRRGSTYEFSSRDLEWWRVWRYDGLLGTSYQVEHRIPGLLRGQMVPPPPPIPSPAPGSPLSPWVRWVADGEWLVRSWVEGLNVWDALALSIRLAQINRDLLDEAVVELRGKTAEQVEAVLVMALLRREP